MFGNKTAYFYPIDMNVFGRCYTYQPPEEILKDGIYRLKISVKASARVFVHNNGVLGVKRSAKDNFVDVHPDSTSYVNVKHNSYKMLDFQGLPCKNENDYHLDKCVLNELEKETLEKIGCLTPFGITKDNICQKKEDAKRAFHLYGTFKKDYLDLTNLTCLEPCSYLSIKLLKISETKSKTGRLVLKFKEKIDQTVAYYSYDDLSLIAEIGGYVGLFLGASIYQIADLIGIIMRKIMIFYK